MAMTKLSPSTYAIRRPAPDPGAAGGGSAACRSRIGVGLSGIAVVVVVVALIGASKSAACQPARRERGLSTAAIVARNSEFTRFES
jgi:hypothetical protein